VEWIHDNNPIFLHRLRYGAIVASNRQNDPQDDSKSHSGSNQQTEHEHLLRRVSFRRGRVIIGSFGDRRRLCRT
jgi:hypothetical protein